jgi:biopolymer transport protein ExbD
MKIRHTTSSGQDKIELQMTPMIDIVFQLLIFFIMTFKIVAQEGDFNINMPQASPQSAPPDQVEFPVLKLYLQSNGGELAGIRLQDEPFPNFGALNRRIIEHIGTDSGPGSNQETAQIEIGFDFDLHYEHVIGAVTAVSGHKTPDKKVHKLIEKIQFLPSSGGGAPAISP